MVEANLVANANDWVLDTEASRHLYANKEMFQDFKKVVDGDVSSFQTPLCNQMCTTSGKTLALSNVLYVPTLCRNLVSSALLNKAGLKLVFEANKVVLSHSGEFVGKGISGCLAW
ncbi:hypothetical protein LIER_27796 [Lithospermum erythrorhizon]|uniref:Retrovirus-related Pol polyprotein from transposon TNT 1-94-like beta-barrel domain-containing protein n=1 Tax=Lithospermum erythrorhizon TaxID=34254 RepID=A0AAV3RF05_LITER